MGRSTLWRLPLWAHVRLMEILDELEEVADDCDDYFALYEDMKSLPDFPLGFTKNDIIYCEITDKRYIH